MGARERIPGDEPAGRGRRGLREARGRRDPGRHLRGDDARRKARLQVARAAESRRRWKGRDGRHVRRRDRRCGARASGWLRCRSSRRRSPMRARCTTRHAPRTKLAFESPQPEAPRLDAVAAFGTDGPGRRADTVEAVAKLRIRTYDKTGTDVFTRLGAQGGRGLVQRPRAQARERRDRSGALLGRRRRGHDKLWEIPCRASPRSTTRSRSHSPRSTSTTGMSSTTPSARESCGRRRKSRRGSGRRWKRAWRRTTSACAPQA